MGQVPQVVSALLVVALGLTVVDVKAIIGPSSSGSNGVVKMAFDVARLDDTIRNAIIKKIHEMLTNGGDIYSNMREVMATFYELLRGTSCPPQDRMLINGVVKCVHRPQMTPPPTVQPSIEKPFVMANPRPDVKAEKRLTIVKSFGRVRR